MMVDWGCSAWAPWGVVGVGVERYVFKKDYEVM